MRNLTLASALLMLAACGDGLQFSHTSTLHQDTRGVALMDGNDARVAMSGTTCDVDPEYASVGTDYNYAGSEDTIHEVEGGKVVVTSDDGAHIVDRSPNLSFGDRDFPINQADYTQAVIVDDGVVLYGETPTGCRVDYGHRPDAGALLKPEICDLDPTIAADPTTGDTWIGTPYGVWVTSPDDGAVEPFVDTAMDLMEYDEATELMYTALSTDTIVRALDLAGTEVWATDVGGTVTDLADFGERAKALVTVQYADGTGAMLVLDGLTGEITDEMGTPDGNQRIAASEGGGQVALIRDNEVHFYEIWKWTNLVEDVNY